MIKIAHISDVHIRKLKYHKEYRDVFEQLYERLKEEKPDIIVNTGDTFHTKLDLSPESVQMMSDLFANLADIAPYHMILGNHDMNLRSVGRLDAISPIVENLNHPDIHFHKYSKTVSIADDIDMHVLSIADPENWVQNLPSDKVNIVLYHGAVNGIATETGWIMTHGDIELETLEKFDYALLGDIHKTNQMLDSKGKARYAGSLCQQNHGESIDKGFLLWEIEDKDDFTCRHIPLKNPKPFVTIELTPKGRMPKLAEVPKGARLRLVSNNNLSLDKMRRAVDIAKHRFKPESVTFLNRALGKKTSDLTGEDFMKENLRDIRVQKKLIEKFLDEYEVEDELLEKVQDLNLRYNKDIEENEEVARNINWELDSFEWDNLFNYGEGNSIDFKNISGIVGIFGKNFSGKSSAIDSLLYTLFNSTSKNERKNLNIINQNKEQGSGRVGISIGDKQYVIERKSEKYIKKLKGEETLEAKTNVEFNEVGSATEEVVCHNGLTRNDTDKNIRKMFGTLDDFMLTAMASQLDSLTFIKEGSTRRKEILAKFLDLEIFDKKFKMAKEDASDLRGALKRLEGKEFDEDMEHARSEIEQSETNIAEHKEQCSDYQKQADRIELLLSDVENKIASIPLEIINIEEAKNALKEKEANVQSIVKKNESLAEESKRNKELIGKLDIFLKDYDIENLHGQKQEASDKNKTYDDLLALLKSKNKDVDNCKNKIGLLSEVPCGSQFTDCKFICDAHKAKSLLPSMVAEVQVLRTKSVQLMEELSNLDVEKINDYLGKYNKLVERQKQTKYQISVSDLQIKNNLSTLEVLKHEIENVENKIALYEENKGAIENLEHFVSQKEEHTLSLRDLDESLAACQKELNELYVSHGSAGQRLQNLIEQKKELSDLREQYSAYDLFMRCMHTSGISYDIIKKILPAINDEIAKILANIVNFEVFFEDDGRRLNVYIKHPSHDPRPIEMGSGAEKTIASMAIRLALLHVSNLPKGDIFVLDEPGTALDAENLEGFVRILNMVKSYFKIVVLISHLDSLKDAVDVSIDINKENGYAKVNV